MTGDPQQNPDSSEHTDIVAQAEEVFSDTVRYLFDVYDLDHDGLMTRREFFTFLWELKKDYPLTEGQMISCWKVVDAKEQNSIDIQEFIHGVEICYERLFFAAENGLRAPEPVFIPNSATATSPNGTPGQRALINNEDRAAYNTVKFKNSSGVAQFEKILEQEAVGREEKKRNEEDKLRSVLSGGNSSSSYTRSTQRAETTTTAAPTSPTRGDKSTVNAGARPLTTFGALARQHQDREARRAEAQEHMARILAEKHRKEKEERERERQKKMESERTVLEKQAVETEPAWKVALRQRQPAQKY